ncbi:MAG: hypothetical protein M1837_001117 [Sclerophora amabilis]|nr:MAG: hypothetical protein M1837_001117 [Sclerophora amabilis]
MASPSHAAKAERSLLPSPFSAESVHPTSLEDSNSQQPQQSLHPSASALPEEQQQQQQLTTPFFTLIEDTATGTHHHPTVHYIFSDDDPDHNDLITDAALHSLHPASSNSSSRESTSTSSSSSSSNPAALSGDDSSQQTSTSTTTTQPRKKKVRNKKEERYIVVDLDVPHPSDHLSASQAVGNPTAAAISARSLTSSWQVLSAELTSAPTWDDAPPAAGVGTEQSPRGPASSPSSRPVTASGGNRQGSEKGNVMLRIEGTEGFASGPEIEGTYDDFKDSGGAGGMATGEGYRNTEREMDELIAVFERRMEVLRRVVQAGEGGGE